MMKCLDEVEVFGSIFNVEIRNVKNVEMNEYYLKRTTYTYNFKKESLTT